MSEIAVVIPCYRVARQAPGVIARIGPEVGLIFAVDDACPEGSGDVIERECRDPRLRVLRHERNLGVGGATITGYRAALEAGATVIVKLDGDGQMDPALIPRLVRPILEGRADYVKGNRFHRLADVAAMPRLRLLGNAALSFLAKLSTGYWQLFDPNNGFTAIHRAVLAELPLARIAKRYFFESDMLHHLGQLRAVVCELPMRAVYGDEPSSLRPLRTILPFLAGHLRNTARRLLYNYFLRGFSPASVELLLAPFLLLFGLIYGLAAWRESAIGGVPATAGQVMLAALPILLGVQFLLSWLHFDVAAEPRQPVHPLLEAAQAPPRQPEPRG
jgi:glycosyltransferase involved in cell wall biosynthesis